MEITLTSIEGNRQWLDGGSMFGNAPRALWEKWVAVDKEGRIPLACRCLLVQTPSLNILCETGIGAFFEPKRAQRFGVQAPETHVLLDNLREHGLEQEDIDYVILSHLHFDHAGGLLPSFKEMQKDDWQLCFPNATYVVGETAWSRARNPHFRDRASFVPELNQKLAESPRLFVVKDNVLPEPLSPFLKFIETSGHTPGQLHAQFQGQKGAVFFAGDLIPGKAWVHLPITMGYDRFPEKVIEEKQRLYEGLSGENLQIFFTHDANIAMANITKNEKGKFVTGLEQTSLVKWKL